MKKNLLTLSIAASVLISCEKETFISEEDGIKYGTSITIVNNTFGLRDFKVGQVGTYPVAFGSLDYGRNLGSGNGYYDSIGFIQFNEDGTGLFKIKEQDSINCEAKFSYGFIENTRNGMHMYINFESAEFKTYVRRKDPPAEVFQYKRAGDGLWVYKTDISKYNGKFIWHANLIFN
jgi:hypothetical protein